MKRHRIARLKLLLNPANILQGVHRLAVDGVDHVTILNADLLGEGILLHQRHHHAPPGIDAVPFLFGQGTRPEAELHFGGRFDLAGDGFERLAAAHNVRTIFVQFSAIRNGDFDGDRLPIAIDAQRGGTAHRRIGDMRDKIVAVLYRRSVHTEDDVAGADSALVGGTALGDTLDDRSVVDAQRFERHFRFHAAIQAHANRAPGHTAEPDDVVIGAGDHVHRQREPDALGTASAGGDHGIHADHLAPNVQQRTAAVARIDGRVRLNEMLEGPCAELCGTAPNGAHDAGGHGRFQTERRADRYGPIAYLHRIRIRDGHRLQLPAGVDLDHRQIRLEVGSDEAAAVVRRIAMQPDPNLGGVLHHVVVGDDVAVLIDNEAAAGSLALRRVWNILPASTAIRTKEPLEEVRHFIAVVIGSLTPDCALLRWRHVHGDVHHAWLELLRQRGEVVAQRRQSRHGQGRRVGSGILIPGRIHLRINQRPDQDAHRKSEQHQGHGHQFLLAHLFEQLHGESLSPWANPVCVTPYWAIVTCVAFHYTGRKRMDASGSPTVSLLAHYSTRYSTRSSPQSASKIRRKPSSRPSG